MRSLRKLKKKDNSYNIIKFSILLESGEYITSVIFVAWLSTCWVRTTGKVCRNVRPSIECKSCTRQSNTTWMCSCKVSWQALASYRSHVHSTTNRIHRCPWKFYCMDVRLFQSSLGNKEYIHLEHILKNKIFRIQIAYQLKDQTNSNRKNVPGKRDRAPVAAWFSNSFGCRWDDQLWWVWSQMDRNWLPTRRRISVSGNCQLRGTLAELSSKCEHYRLPILRGICIDVSSVCVQPKVGND